MYELICVLNSYRFPWIIGALRENSGESVACVAKQLAEGGGNGMKGVTLRLTYLHLL